MAWGGSNRQLPHIEDANGDDFDDLIVQILDVDGMFREGNGEATLTGDLYDGTPIEGSDTICIVP